MNQIPIGLCGCGCGQRTPLATKTQTLGGRIKGQPTRFMRGHSEGRPPLSPEQRRAYQQQWRKANRESCRAYQQQWYEAHRERRLAQSKQNYTANRERILLRGKQYRQGNELDRIRRKKYQDTNHAIIRERNRAATFRWRQAHPEQARALLRRWQKANWNKYIANVKAYALRRRAIMRGMTGVAAETFSRWEVWKRDGGICGICALLADSNDWHVDHIVPLAKGGPHLLANAQVAHPVCNLRKNVKLI